MIFPTPPCLRGNDPWIFPYFPNFYRGRPSSPWICSSPRRAPPLPHFLGSRARCASPWEAPVHHGSACGCRPWKYGHVQTKRNTSSRIIYVLYIYIYIHNCNCIYHCIYIYNNNIVYIYIIMYMYIHHICIIFTLSQRSPPSHV